jgi:ABC-2 type transport system ATP-binding protein
MISVLNLVKNYGRAPAVAGISFVVKRGDVLGFLGPNGAGKSTTLRVLAGFLGMTRGQVLLDGHDITTDAHAARRCIGYMPESVPLYPEMRVDEYLTFRAELKGVARSARRTFVGDAMEKVRVADKATTLIGRLSKGYRQRVGLADALVARPPILILDEPTAGLDPNQILDVRALIKSLGRDHTVLVSTHILSEVEATCNRVLVLAKGKIVAEGTTDGIRALTRRTSLDLTVRGDALRAADLLRAHDGVAFTEVLGKENDASDDASTLRVTWTSDLAATALAIASATECCVKALVVAGIGVREVRAHGGRLEDVFAELTRDERGAAS